MYCLIKYAISIICQIFLPAIYEWKLFGNQSYTNFRFGMEHLHGSDASSLFQMYRFIYL